MHDKAIMCVDDEKTVLDSLKEQLKKNFGDEFLYESAESAEEAEEVIDELSLEGIRILIIVSDWLMPRIKGDEFLINIHKKHPEIVKVLITGQADQESIERAKREANLFKVIHKPWTEEELVETIRNGMRL
jgi:DNA-binding NtrC family response regulator